ncbi:Trans-1,2-dihydrobenzene-1,2-diol dehydrogenase [Candidatus Methylobacter favarea]|uniref:Trans-1,2-dihydrobenzene-1,2-diol dehydrogenase n=1 Tax=Candidatus Methylobacter favarea TaxID=2707345 RepID=A0A8S0XHX2_9GAMM|nr:Gfo/Idh/MocA family oxidoreductase [Candidatus Methylobacter favarea]CAA9890113.1 Trans-1,2-dihydrobenzene-1,2-diol dehydrogenase [Candidatus Methylobacter favarea]
MHTESTLRWGILGAARVNERLLPAIVEAANARLVAIASRRPGAAAQTLAQFAPHQQNVQTYDCLEALLDDPGVQAVYVPLANQEHADWVLRAIERGKHVLCEKPMALTVADIEAIKSAASAHKVTVMEGFMYRFHPQHARVQELIRSGTIGEVRSVRASYSFMMRPARQYRLVKSVELGGGAMWDIGCYAIHSARMFFEQTPVAVTAMAKYVESGADSASSGIIDFGAGQYAHFDFSFERARRSEYEITGTKGGIKCHTVWLLPNDVPVISWWTEEGRQCEEHLPGANHFRLEIEHFSECVLTGSKPLLSLDDAKANCQLIVAALQSAAQGRVVNLAD